MRTVAFDSQGGRRFTAQEQGDWPLPPATCLTAAESMRVAPYVQISTPKKNLTLSAGIGKIPFECRRTYPCTGVHKTGASLLPQRRTRLWVACGRCTPRNATAGILLITPHRFPRFIPCQIEFTCSGRATAVGYPVPVISSPCRRGGRSAEVSFGHCVSPPAGQATVLDEDRGRGRDLPPRRGISARHQSRPVSWSPGEGEGLCAK